MTRANTRPAVAAFLMLTELLGGCGAQPMKDKGTGTGAQSQSPQPAPPFAGEAEMITGTATPHKQKDAPVETERISGKQLEEAGATHTGQVLQDVPAIQPRR